LEAAGCSVELSFPGQLADPKFWAAAATVLAVNLAVEVQTWSKRLGRDLGEDDLEPTTWRLTSAGRAVSGVDLMAAHTLLLDRTAEAELWWANFDVLVTPTTAGPATLLGEYTKSYESGRGSAFTRPFNVTGQPAVTVPLGWPEDGLPRGVQIIAPLGRDDLLVTVAAALEELEPWSHRRATVSA
jgi:amidase